LTLENGSKRESCQGSYVGRERMARSAKAWAVVVVCLSFVAANSANAVQEVKYIYEADPNSYGQPDRGTVAVVVLPVSALKWGRWSRWCNRCFSFCQSSVLCLRVATEESPVFLR
jgi:hypothetical protein